MSSNGGDVLSNNPGFELVLVIKTMRYDNIAIPAKQDTATSAVYWSTPRTCM